MEKTITKTIQKDELFSGERPAVETLYNRYGGMLFSYIQQFVPSRAEAEDLLVNIFARLASRIESAFDSGLSVYCWLQIEARKIILEGRPDGYDRVNPQRTYYASLLEDASSEHQRVFRELFVNGRQREELAFEMHKDAAYIGDILKECMIIIRNRLA